jgi:hypothetical protein
MRKESDIYLAISKYMAIKYPNVIWRFDFSAGMKMTLGQAKRHKAMNPHRGYPDLFICKCRGGYGGLYLEIKQVNIRKKDGQLFTDKHLQEQSEMLLHLERSGYKAEFAVGLQQCIAKIDSYLSL